MANDCLICFANPTNTLCVPCNHRYCLACWSTYTMLSFTKNFCPTCRKKVDRTENVPIFMDLTNGFYGASPMDKITTNPNEIIDISRNNDCGVDKIVTNHMNVMISNKPSDVISLELFDSGNDNEGDTESVGTLIDEEVAVSHRKENESKHDHRPVSTPVDNSDSHTRLVARTASNPLLGTSMQLDSIFKKKKDKDRKKGKTENEMGEDGEQDPPSSSKNSRPKKRYTEQEQDVCVICQEDDEGATQAQLPCGHCFHKECILTWVKKSTSITSNCCNCPMCRKSVASITIIKNPSSLSSSSAAAPILNLTQEVISVKDIVRKNVNPYISSGYGNNRSLVLIDMEDDREAYENDHYNELNDDMLRYVQSWGRYYSEEEEEEEDSYEDVEEEEVEFHQASSSSSSGIATGAQIGTTSVYGSLAFAASSSLVAGDRIALSEQLQEEQIDNGIECRYDRLNDQQKTSRLNRLYRASSRTGKMVVSNSNDERLQIVNGYKDISRERDIEIATNTHTHRNRNTLTDPASDRKYTRNGIKKKKSRRNIGSIRSMEQSVTIEEKVHERKKKEREQGMITGYGTVINQNQMKEEDRKRRLARMENGVDIIGTVDSVKKDLDELLRQQLQQNGPIDDVKSLKRKKKKKNHTTAISSRNRTRKNSFK